MTRIELLSQIEANAWQGLVAAHRRLAQFPPDTAAAAAFRTAARVAEQRWRRAITDLDRALSRPVEARTA